MTHTNYAVPPGHYLQEWLIEHHRSFREAATILPIETDVFLDVLNGHTPVTEHIAAALADLTSISKDTWLRFETRYQQDSTRLAGTSTEPNDELGDPTILDELALAITNVAAERNNLDPYNLLMDAAINIVILTRITTQRLTTIDQRAPIDVLADDLAAAMRRCARELQP